VQRTSFLKILGDVASDTDDAITYQMGSQVNVVPKSDVNTDPIDHQVGRPSLRHLMPAPFTQNLKHAHQAFI
jgi:hypothetical protein